MVKTTRKCTEFFKSLNYADIYGLNVAIIDDTTSITDMRFSIERLLNGVELQIKMQTND